MGTGPKIAIFALVLLGLGLWIFDMHPHIVDASAPPSISLVPLEPGVLAAKTNVLPSFQETGVLIYDMAAGAPGTPYLVYLNQKGQLTTKQLIFSDEGCDASAGDLPCLYSPSPTPAIPAGTALTVTGGEQVQGVFADSYKTAAVPSNMVVFSATLNQPVTLSDGSSVTLLGIADDASCTLGIGCFGDGVDRAAMQLSNGSGTSTTEMVPGAIHEYGKTTFVVLSMNGAGANVSANVLAVETK